MIATVILIMQFYLSVTKPMLDGKLKILGD